MKILLVHNFYQQPGGEDTVFAAESSLLKNNGHTVVEYTDHNDRIANLKNISIAFQTIWSHQSYKKLTSMLDPVKPDIVHFHNTFPLGY